MLSAGGRPSSQRLLELTKPSGPKPARRLAPVSPRAQEDSCPCACSPPPPPDAAGTAPCHLGGCATPLLFGDCDRELSSSNSRLLICRPHHRTENNIPDVFRNAQLGDGGECRPSFESVRPHFSVHTPSLSPQTRSPRREGSGQSRHRTVISGFAPLPLSLQNPVNWAIRTLHRARSRYLKKCWHYSETLKPEASLLLVVIDEASRRAGSPMGPETEVLIPKAVRFTATGARQLPPRSGPQVKPGSLHLCDRHSYATPGFLPTVTTRYTCAVSSYRVRGNMLLNTRATNKELIK